jgi:hypothetical protein
MDYGLTRFALVVGTAMAELLLRKVAPRAGADGIEDYDVITAHDGLVIGRIVRVTTTPPDTPWLWTISTGERHDFGRDATREAAMQALARNWERET